MITDPIFYLVAIPAVLLTGISKGGFGGALAGMAVPLMSLTASPAQAAAVMLPILCVIDLVGFRVYFRKWDTENLKILIPGGLIGVFLGWLAFGSFSDGALRLGLGAISILFPLSTWIGVAMRQARAGRSVVKGTFWSGMAGFTSFVAHSGGPPLLIYLIPQRLDKVTYVATVNLFFMIMNAVKLVPYAGLGQLSTSNLGTSLLLAPIVPIGVWIGLWAQGKVDQAKFYRITEIGMLLTGLQLIHHELAGHWTL